MTFCDNIARTQYRHFPLIFIAKFMLPNSPRSNNSVIYNADINHMAIYRPYQVSLCFTLIQ